MTSRAPSQRKPLWWVTDPPTARRTGRPWLVTCRICRPDSLKTAQDWVDAPESAFTKISARAGAVRVGVTEAAHPASAMAASPPVTTYPILDIATLLPRRDHPRYLLHAPTPRQVAPKCAQAASSSTGCGCAAASADVTRTPRKKAALSAAARTMVIAAP